MYQNGNYDGNTDDDQHDHISSFHNDILCHSNLLSSLTSTIDAEMILITASTNYKVNVISVSWLLLLFFTKTTSRLQLAIPFDEVDGYSKCTMYDVNFTHYHMLGLRKADPSWPTKSCKYGWEYNFTEIPYSTIATEVIKITSFKSFLLKIYLHFIATFTDGLGMWECLFTDPVPVDILHRCHCRWLIIRVWLWMTNANLPVNNCKFPGILLIIMDVFPHWLDVI